MYGRRRNFHRSAPTGFSKEECVPQQCLTAPWGFALPEPRQEQPCNAQHNWSHTAGHCLPVPQARPLRHRRKDITAQMIFLQVTNGILTGTPSQKQLPNLFLQGHCGYDLCWVKLCNDCGSRYSSGRSVCRMVGDACDACAAEQGDKNDRKDNVSFQAKHLPVRMGDLFGRPYIIYQTVCLSQTIQAAKSKPGEYRRSAWLPQWRLQ